MGAGELAKQARAALAIGGPRELISCLFNGCALAAAAVALV